MLKLLKYECAAVGRIILPTGGLMVAISLLMRCLSMLYDHFFSKNDMSDLGSIALVTTFLLAVCVVVAAIVLTIVTVIRRYYLSLYGDEGYLTNTLPVAPWKHIASKLIVAVAAVVVTLLFTGAALFFLMGDDLSELWHELAEWIAGFHNIGVLIYTMVINLLGGLVGIIAFLLTVYAAIAIGQLWREHRVAGGLLAYLGISFVLNIAETVVLAVTEYMRETFVGAAVNTAEGLDTYSFIGTMLDSINADTAIGLIQDIIICVVMFLVADQLLKHKLNIQ